MQTKWFDKLTTRWKNGLMATGATVAMAATLFSGSALAQRAYTDVPPQHWAYDAVQWASQYGIMVGRDQSGMFEAAAFANRAEIATIMHRFFVLMDGDVRDLRIRIELLEDRLDDLESHSSSARSSSSRWSSSSMSSSSSFRSSSVQSSMSSSMSSASSMSSTASSASSLSSQSSSTSS